MINYTITLSLLICAVILLRAVFRKKVPQRLIYALWLVVLIKMCLPFSFIALDIPTLSAVYPNSVGSITAETTTVFEAEVKDSSVITNPPITQPPETLPPSVTAKPIVTAPPTAEIITAPSVTAPSVTRPPVTVPSVTAPTEVTNPTPAQPKQNVFDLGKTLFVVSLLGSVAVGAFFGLSAIQFSAKLREDRVFLKKEGRVSVYISQNAITPCVFGLIPKIYLTPEAAESENLDLVLRHELTHIRHGDNLWTIVRTAALIIFWYNPLVWAAAMLSRRDSELACDEALAAHLDSKGRSTYAHTIIDSIPQKRSHAPGLSGAPLKERLIMITKKSKNSVICIILALVLTLGAAGCSFIGSKPQTPDDTTKPSDTGESADTTTPSGDENIPDDDYTPPSVELLIPSPTSTVFGENEISITAYEAVGGYPYVTELDDTYFMLTIYGTDKRDISIKIINRHTGKMEADFPIDGDLAPSSLYSVIEDGYVLYDVECDPPGVVSQERFWTLTLKDGVFSIAESDAYTGNPRFYQYTSPDGKYLAYREYIPDEDIYGIFIEDADGGVTLIAKDRPVYADHPDGWWLGYIPRGFLDNDTLIYNTGSEGTAEYGIYRISTKENTVFDRGYEVFGIIDGKAYVAGTNYASVYSVGTVDRDGNYTALSVPDTYSPLVLGGEQDIMDICGKNWIFAQSSEDYASFPHQASAFYLFSEDMSTMTAKIDIPSDRRLERAIAGDGHLTLILSKQIGEESPPDDTTEPEPDTTPYVTSIIPRPVDFAFGENIVQINTFETPVCSNYPDYANSFVANQIYGTTDYQLLWTYRVDYPERDVSVISKSSVYLFNTGLGKIEASAKLPDTFRIRHSVMQDDGSVIISGYDELATEDVSFVLSRDSTLESIDYLHIEDPRDAAIFEKTFVSPDGKTKVQNIYKESVKIIYPSGEEKTVLPRVDTDPDGLYATVSYACGFIDNERFVYDQLNGYIGIYNVNTHENVVYENSAGQTFVAFGEDGIYTLSHSEGSFHGEVGLLDRDGVFHIYEVPEGYSGIFGMHNIYFCNGKWVVVSGNELYVFSYDLKTILAQADLPQNRTLHDMIINGDRISLFFSEENETDSSTEPEDTPAEPGVIINSYFGEVTDSPIEFTFGKEAAGVEVSVFEKTGYVSSAKIDSEHLLFCRYDAGENSVKTNITAYIVNLKTGKIVQTEYLDDGEAPAYTFKTMENGVIVNSYSNADGEITSWEVKRDGDKFTITEVPYNPYYDMIESIDEEFTSPDGKTTVYNFDGHVSVRGEDGVKRAVLQTHLTEPGNELTGRGYTAIGFLDNDRFVYRIGGWEWTYGYGIYNVKTGEKIEYENGFSAQGIYNGKVYSTLNEHYEFGGKIGILDEDGVHREISIPEKYASIIGDQPIFYRGKWFCFKYDIRPYSYTLSGIYVFSDDLSELIAEIKMTQHRPIDSIYFYDGRINLIMGKEVEFEESPPEPEDTTEPPELSAELKLEIQKAYAESHNKNNPDKPITQEDVGVYGYCGEYSGAHVVTILRSGCSYPAIIESIIVNGEEISYSYPPPSVYKNGEFYGVEYAFEKGILSAEDIKALAELTKRR